MSMIMLSKTQQQHVVQSIEQELGAHTVILFGSFAKGMPRADSDIDLAYLTDVKNSAYRVFMLAQQLAEFLHREVDLIDFQSASTVFQAQIVSSGILLLDEDPYRRQQQFMVALKAYALLNEERAVILENIDP